MAVRNDDCLTLADLAKRQDSKGNLAEIVEVLNQTNDILIDMPWMECNDGSGHKTVIRTGIPEAAWRLFNYGVPQVKTSTAQIRDTTGMLEVYSKVDKKLADYSGNGKGYRLSEAEGIMEGMNQQMARTVFYGNILTNPERFMGLSPRYSDGRPANAANAENVINGGGTAALGQTSIWLIGWGKNGCAGLYPQNLPGGLKHEDLGEDTFTDERGFEYQGYRDHFEWNCGLTLKDWRHVIRIANVEVARLNDNTYMQNIINLMIQASEQTPTTSSATDASVGDQSNNGGIKYVFYANRRVRSAMRVAINNKVSGQLTWETYAGKKVVSFDGTPVHRVDALLSTEAVVPFA